MNKVAWNEIRIVEIVSKVEEIKFTHSLTIGSHRFHCVMHDTL